MAHKTFDFTVDFNNKKRLAVANVKQNDTAVFNILIVEDGKPIDLTNQQLRLFINKPDNKLVVQDDNITVIDAKRGSIRINVKNSAFQAIGTAVAELDVWGTNKENASSQNFFIEVDEQLGSNDAVKSYVDVNLFRQLTEYIDTANTNIAKYRAVMEAFTKAGISAQGLLDIKAYIDNNLAGLKAETNEAVSLIPQVNKARTDAEAKRVEVVNVTNAAEAKRKEVTETTDEADQKMLELRSTISTSNTSKANLETATVNADKKKKEVEGATASAESKRVEVVNATNAGNNTKTALDRATATAEAKRVEVVNATNTASTKIPALEKIIAEADTQGIISKGLVPTSRDCNDFKDLNAWIAWDTGNGDFKNTPEGYLAKGTSRVFVLTNRGFATTRVQQECIYVYPKTRVTKWVRNYQESGWGAWYKTYDEANKPTPQDIGAVNKNGDTMNGTLRFEANGNEIEIVNPSQGLQARGMVFKDNYEANNIIGMFGAYMNAHDMIKTFMGITATPWDGRKSLTVDKEGCYYDNKKIYHTGSKPTPEEIGALNTNGDRIHGNLYFDAGKVLVTANNYGIKGLLSDGSTSDYMLYMGADGRIKLSYGNRPVDVQAKDFKVNGQELPTIADFSRYPNTNGFQKLPSGLIIQWGVVSKSLQAGQDGQYFLDVAFPTVFPHASLCVVGTPLANKWDAGKIKWLCQSEEYNYYSNNNKYATFKISVDTAGGNTTASIKWIAIGY